MKKLKGSSISISEMNRALHGVADPDDIPLLGKERLELWDEVKPKMTKPIGTVIITGTGGGINDDFGKLWDWWNKL